jgi:CheY-like chemotaxis protein
VAHIVILEDNADRKAVMRSCLAARFPQYETRFFDDAAEMIAYLKDSLSEAIVLSLDHDLELKPGSDGRWIDPGTGREVADYLAASRPTCPVIIHTSNSNAAVGMEMVLAESNWRTHRVIPMEDTKWIPREWLRIVRRVIRRVAKAEPSTTRPDQALELS